MKIETTQTAYISSAYDMSMFMRALSQGKTDEAAKRTTTADCDMTDSGWTKVGIAHISIELLDVKDIQHEQLAALQAQLQKERADSQVRQNLILEQISKLQAIEYVEAV